MAKITLLILAFVLPALVLSGKNDNGLQCKFVGSDGKGVYSFDNKLNGGEFGISFEVIANSDVLVALSPVNQEHESMYIISIGGETNAVSSIRKKGGDIVANFDASETPRKSELRCQNSCMNTYWICFKQNMLSVGRGGEREPFLEYLFDQDSSFDPEYVGFSTGNGSPGMFANIKSSTTCESQIQETAVPVTTTLQPRSCPVLDCGDIRCTLGFKKDANGCFTCECKASSCMPLTCTEVCVSGYEVNDEGCLTCQCKTGPCDSSPCQNSGNCFGETSDSYACYCKNGFTGTNCETDEQPPEITCPENMDVSDPATPTLTATATDNDGEEPTIECPKPSEVLTLGVNIFTCTAKDSAGNTVGCDYTITLTDEVPPSITCPDDMDLKTDIGKSFATVTYISPTASDNDGPPTVECVPNSLTLEIGVNEIKCTATDAADNTKICGYKINVNDEQPPEITCPENMDVSDPATPTLTATATDNDGEEPTIECPKPSEVLTLGVNIFTCTAKDSAGNTVGCDYTITLTDTTPPTVTCPVAMTVKVPADDLWEIPNASDDDGTKPAVTCTPSNPATMTYVNGDNEIMCEATDEAGNIGKCSFKIVLVPEECTFQTVGNQLNLYQECATPLTPEGLSKICYRLKEANNDVYLSIWNKQSGVSTETGMINLHMSKDNAIVSGPITGTKDTTGFCDGKSEMCIKRLPSTVIITFQEKELWNVPFEEEDNTEVGFASSLDATWIVQPSYGTQSVPQTAPGRRRRSLAEEPDFLKKAPTRRRRAPGVDWSNESTGEGALKVVFQKFARRRR